MFNHLHYHFKWLLIFFLKICIRVTIFRPTFFFQVSPLYSLSWCNEQRKTKAFKKILRGPSIVLKVKNRIKKKTKFYLQNKVSKKICRGPSIVLIVKNRIKKKQNLQQWLTNYCYTIRNYNKTLIC